MSTPWLASVLQTTDPLFPIGSYAHSYGLEELTLSGKVASPEELYAFLASTVSLNLESFDLPYLRFAYATIQTGDFDELSLIDEEISAAKFSRETRAASISQGQQRLRLIAKLRPSDNISRLVELKQAKRLQPNHLVIFAAENVDLETPLEAALTAWAYQALAAPCAAALKLMRIGQEATQTVLTQSLQLIDPIILNSLEVERDFAGAFLPNLDIASHRHERAYARLFIS